MALKMKGSFDVPNEHWEYAEKIVADNLKAIKDHKLDKKDCIIKISKNDPKHKGKIKNSFLVVYPAKPTKNNKPMIVALADKIYLGKGTVGDVKIGQLKPKANGEIIEYAVKIERGKFGIYSEEKETKILTAAGQLIGTITKEASGQKSKRVYSVLPLLEGKELYKQLVHNLFPSKKLFGTICLSCANVINRLIPFLRKKMKKDLALAIAYKAAKGIQDLHNRGILHLDIKPENMMASLNGKCEVIPIDFGQSLQLEKKTNGQFKKYVKGHPVTTIYNPPDMPWHEFASFMRWKKNIEKLRKKGYTDAVLEKKGIPLEYKKMKYSTKSDIYSLGKMFQIDLLISSKIIRKMCNKKPNKRPNLKKVMKNLKTKLLKINPQAAVNYGIADEELGINVTLNTLEKAIKRSNFIKSNYILKKCKKLINSSISKNMYLEKYASNLKLLKKIVKALNNKNLLKLFDNNKCSARMKEIISKEATKRNQNQKLKATFNKFKINLAKGFNAITNLFKKKDKYKKKKLISKINKKKSPPPPSRR